MFSCNEITYDKLQIGGNWKESGTLFVWKDCSKTE